jgi:hypothetical protein
VHNFSISISFQGVPFTENHISVSQTPSPFNAALPTVSMLRVLVLSVGMSSVVLSMPATISSTPPPSPVSLTAGSPLGPALSFGQDLAMLMIPEGVSFPFCDSVNGAANQTAFAPFAVAMRVKHDPNAKEHPDLVLDTYQNLSEGQRSGYAQPPSLELKAFLENADQGLIYSEGLAQCGKCFHFRHRTTGKEMTGIVTDYHENGPVFSLSQNIMSTLTGGSGMGQVTSTDEIEITPVQCYFK